MTTHVEIIEKKFLQVSGMIRKAKDYGKIGNVDTVQILSIEDLIDNNKTFQLPTNSPLTI
jgi:hypothetical protein